MSSKDQQPDEAWRIRCCELADRLVAPLRATAREHGYALAVHGSLARDIDLIAVPWRWSGVSPPRVLAEAIQARAAELNDGMAYEKDHEGAANPDYFFNGCPGAKPQGRLVWAFHLGGGPYIDLAVMPANEDP
jgi:hypothetical protein